ncbi:thioesterase family protein [Sulfurimonas sp. HSL1-6]|uniref:thioesterase family protein n=1 Tax=Thiomicrolovo immobilis TaxID=3131935 RepID=UPI0031F84A70
MSQYFTKSFRVDWSDANAYGRVHLPTYFRYLIETAWDWGAAVGLGIEDSRKLGLAWVVRETQINLLQPLSPEDTFELTIWLAHWRRVHGTRYFELVHKASGAVIAQGAQEVVTLDMKSMRPKAVPKAIVERMTIETPRTVPHRPFPAFSDTFGRAVRWQRTVTWQDLDTLEHVNNTKYVAFAEDAAVAALAEFGWAPKDFKAQGLAVKSDGVQIQYLTPAVWGETLELETLLSELGPGSGVWHVAIARAEDREPVARCVMAWSAVDASDGTLRKIPEELHRRLLAHFTPPQTAPQG